VTRVTLCARTQMQLSDYDDAESSAAVAQRTRLACVLRSSCRSCVIDEVRVCACEV
jgi:hypothetical protein